MTGSNSSPALAKLLGVSDSFIASERGLWANADGPPREL